MAENEEMNLKEKLEEALTDEENDADKYTNLADYAKVKYPDCGYGQILKDIAHEEQIHHKHIRAILDDMKKKETESKWM